MRHADGSVRSVAYVMSDLRRYPLGAQTRAALAAQFPMHGFLFNEDFSDEPLLERAVQILLSGLGRTVNDIWRSCEPFATELVLATVGETHGLARADAAQIVKQAYLVCWTCCTLSVRSAPA